jgi:hypothetical protein
MKSPLCFLPFLAAVPICHAATVSLPYSDDFNGATTDLTPGTTAPIGGAWAITGGTYQNTNVPQNTSAALIQASNFVPGLNFQLSTTFTVTDTSSNFSVGFAALGTGSSLQTAGVNYYLADIATDGTLRIGSFTATTFNATSPFFAGSAGIGPIVNTDVVTMTLDGVYTGSSLVLTLSASKNGGAVASASTGTINSPFAGSNFGLRNRNGATAGSGDNMVVQFENFSMTQVPEPGALLLGVLGAIGLGLRRKR